MTNEIGIGTSEDGASSFHSLPFLQLWGAESLFGYRFVDVSYHEEREN